MTEDVLIHEREGQPPGLGVQRGAVLVVEDDPANLEALVELLGAWGYEPIRAASAEEAERLIDQRQIRSAIVDVFLPGRSGAALLIKLRERFPEAVLVGISGLSDAEMARALKGVGADAFIGKPVSPEELARVLTSAHVSWH